MKKLLVFVSLISLCGCAYISGERVDPYGANLRIKSARFLWASEGIKTTVKDTNGLSFTLDIQRANPDAQALGAIAEGTARGMSK